MRQEESICTIEDSYRNILSFLSGLTTVLSDHRFHNLTLKIDRYGSHVSCLDHPLLGDHELLWRQLLSKLVSENNNTVGVLKDSFELVNSFEVIDLGEDANLVASVSAGILDLLNVFD